MQTSRPNRNTINDSSNPQQNLIFNSGTATIGRVMGRGIGYLTQILLARLLAPEGFGLFAIGWTLLRLFSIAGHLGLDYGVVKFGSKYWGKNPAKLRSMAFNSIGGALLSGLLFGLALYVLAPWLATEFFKKPGLEFILQGFAFTFPFATTLRVLAATSSLSGRMLCGAIAEDMAQPILQIILFLVLFFLNRSSGLDAALISTVVSYGISVVLGAICATRAIPGVFSPANISVEDFRSLLKFSLPAIAGVTLGAFNLWGDRLLVGYFGTEADAGIYQSISVITMLTTTVLSGIKISISPLISQMHHDGNYNGINTLVKSVTRWILYISIPILLIVFVQAETIIVVIFGREYQSGALPLAILTVGQVFYMAFGIMDQIYLMTGNQKEWLGISAGIFVATVVLDAVFIPRAHLVGASLVSSAMMLLLACISTIILKYKLRFWHLDVFHVRIVVAAALTAIPVHFILLNLHFNPVSNLLIAGVNSFFIFAVVLLVLGMEPSDGVTLRHLIQSAYKTKTPH